MSSILKWGLIGGSVVLLTLLILVIVLLKKRSSIKENTEFPELLEALGGKDNISNLVLNGSRISLTFDNKKIVDKESIKENGVETIVIANKKITLVIGKKASAIYKYLKEELN